VRMTTSCEITPPYIVMECTNSLCWFSDRGSWLSRSSGRLTDSVSPPQLRRGGAPKLRCDLEPRAAVVSTARVCCAVEIAGDVQDQAGGRTLSPFLPLKSCRIFSVATHRYNSPGGIEPAGALTWTEP
jgi:hypothetical protein